MLKPFSGRVQAWYGSFVLAGLLIASVSGWFEPARVRAAEEAEAGKWANISDRVLAEVTGAGKKIGYPGGTAGITVDPATGEVYLVVPDNGLWKSTDQGATFKRVDGGKIGGRCETGFALQFDPAGKRLACFMIYGACASTNDGGGTFMPWTTNHLDFGAVDWEHTGKAMVAFRHEAGGVLCVSADGGATWRNLGRTGADGKVVKEEREYTALGMFDAKTLMASKGRGILRSTDGGETWTKVADAKLTAPVMEVRGGVGYWMTDKGVLVSMDKGATWRLAYEVDAVFGPWFGTEERHMVVVGKKGFMETRDGGETWKVVAPLPPGYNVGLVGPNYAWDVKRDIFYASSMGKPAFKLHRK